jgi:hypothetical protein
MLINFLPISSKYFSEPESVKIFPSLRTVFPVLSSMAKEDFCGRSCFGLNGRRVEEAEVEAEVEEEVDGREERELVLLLAAAAAVAGVVAGVVEVEAEVYSDLDSEENPIREEEEALGVDVDFLLPPLLLPLSVLGCLFFLLGVEAEAEEAEGGGGEEVMLRLG